MKKDKQVIKCNVFNCRYCDIKEECCNLREIKVCNCNDKENKESTMCNSYINKED